MYKYNDLKENWSYNEWPEVDINGKVIEKSTNSKKTDVNLNESVKQTTLSQKKLRERKLIKQYVHYDKNGTVDAIADTPKELADILGIDKMSVLNAIARHYPDYARVTFDEDDEFDDIDISKNESKVCSDCGKEICECGNMNITEAKKENKHPDLSNVETSMTSAIQKNMEKFSAAKTKEEVLDILKAALSENEIDTPASKKLILRTQNAEDYYNALSTVMNSMLAGCNLRVNEELTEAKEDEDVDLKAQVKDALDAFVDPDDADYSPNDLIDAVLAYFDNEEAIEYIKSCICTEEPDEIEEESIDELEPEK